LSDDLTMMDKILTGVILALSGGMGVQRYQQSRVEKIIDEHNLELKELREKVRDKADCADICMTFQKAQERMTDKMEAGFQRLYDKLEQKEDKHE